MRRRVRAAVLALALGWPLEGCAEPPRPAIDAARQALDAARTTEARTYATESLAVAEAAAARISAELALQEGRAGVMRSYQKAERLAELAQLAALNATAESYMAREKVRQQASLAIEANRVVVAESRTKLHKLPKAMRVRAETRAAEADLAATETAIREAQIDLVRNRVAQAMANAETAGNAAEKASRELDEITKRMAAVQ